MRVFLLSCVAVVLIALGAYALLDGFLTRNAGDAFAIQGSTRVSNDDKPDPSGALSHLRAPAGGVTSGRTQAPGQIAPQAPGQTAPAPD